MVLGYRDWSRFSRGPRDKTGVALLRGGALSLELPFSATRAAGVLGTFATLVFRAQIESPHFFRLSVAHLLPVRYRYFRKHKK